MSSTATVSIPFESQSDPQIRRDCGAACLSMVYRSFGKTVTPAEIWPAIAQENRFGIVSSTTHLMAKDALDRGFSAVAFQASSPLQALRLCNESGIRAIPNHRPSADSPAGHYTVLVDVEARDVVLHDPFYGPSRRIPHAELMELWHPSFANSEIAGYMLIAIAAEPLRAPACWLCHAPLPATVACPRCKERVALEPSQALGCIDRSCIARMWNYVFCPFCDCGFTLSPQAAVDTPAEAGPPGPASASAQPAPPPEKNPLDFGRMIAEVDKFCTSIRAVPGAEGHPEIKKKLEFIASSEDKLKLAMAEALLQRKAHQEQLAKMLDTAKQNADAHRQRVVELQRPAPPLDGNALGRALLKNLGFIE